MHSGDRSLDDLAAESGLPNGRMIAPSKTAYSRRHPTHVVLFNATITGEHGDALWWGDLDLSLDEPKLIALAVALGRDLHVMFEGDVIRSHTDSVDPALAVVTVSPSSIVRFSTDPHWRLTRDESGRIIWGSGTKS